MKKNISFHEENSQPFVYTRKTKALQEVQSPSFTRPSVIVMFFEDA